MGILVKLAKDKNCFADISQNVFISQNEVKEVKTSQKVSSALNSGWLIEVENAEVVAQKTNLKQSKDLEKNEDK